MSSQTGEATPSPATVMAVAEKLAHDTALRDRAAAGDTADLLSELGLDVPSDTTVKILMNADDLRYVVLPPQANGGAGDATAKSLEYAVSLAEKLAHDDTLRARAAAGDTADLLPGLGIDVPPTTTVKILLDADDSRHLVLPPVAENGDSKRELSDEELGQIAGGVNWEPIWGSENNNYSGDWFQNRT